jgi:hypothetical protein
MLNVNQYNDTWHNDAECCFVLSVAYAERHIFHSYAERYYTECHYSKCCYTGCRGAPAP